MTTACPRRDADERGTILRVGVVVSARAEDYAGWVTTRLELAGVP